MNLKPLLHLARTLHHIIPTTPYTIHIQTTGQWLVAQNQWTLEQVAYVWFCFVLFCAVGFVCNEAPWHHGTMAPRQHQSYGQCAFLKPGSVCTESPDVPQRYQAHSSRRWKQMGLILKQLKGLLAGDTKIRNILPTENLLDVIDGVLSLHHICDLSVE